MEVGNLKAPQLYPFHHSNIQEHRLAAYVARAVPLVLILTVAAAAATGVLWYRMLLIVITAFMNVWFWVWLVSHGVYALVAGRASKRAMDECAAASVEEAGAESVVHLVLLPNYKEDISILATTLEALAEARGAAHFRVVLAFEAREGRAVAEAKAERLLADFGSRFGKLSAVYHPVDLQQRHLDGSVIDEVAGKSSNLKWAVSASFEDCQKDGVDKDRVVLTVADADCIFHPSYFARVGSEFDKLSEAAGSPHQWTIWQPPQLLFRNYSDCTSPSRIWAYFTAFYEFGGSGRLLIGGQHMTFSSFSLSLTLVERAAPWEGDIIADDYHCFLKCFLYSIWHRASQADALQNPAAHLRVQPVMLPVKSTGVVAENCLASWRSRFSQAKRHAQGVNELAYLIMGTWSLLWNLPRKARSFELMYSLYRVLLVPLNVCVLPLMQAVPFAILSLYWLFNGQSVPECEPYWLHMSEARFYLCVFSGGWNLIVPVVIPVALFMLISYYSVSTFCLRPAGTSPGSVWHREDGGLSGSKTRRLVGLLLVDFLVMLAPVMLIFGAIPQKLSYWQCLVGGNDFKFQTAAKKIQTPPPPMAAVQTSIRDVTLGRTSGPSADSDEVAV